MIKRLFIFILFLCGFSYYLGVYDFLNFRKNNVMIDLPFEMNDVEVLFVSGEDTLMLFSNGIMLKKRMPDWYGKDHVIVKRKDVLHICSFNFYKKKSYHKVSFSLGGNHIDSMDNYFWKLSTIWNVYDGEFEMTR